MNRGIGRYIPPMGYAVMQREKEEAEQKARAAERRRAEDALQAAQAAEEEAAEEEDQRVAEAEEAQAATAQAEAEDPLSVPPVDDDRVEPPRTVASKKVAPRRNGARPAPPSPRRKGKGSRPKSAAARRPGPARRGRQLEPIAPEPPLTPLLTTPALLRGEDPAEYADLLSRVLEEVQPGDAVEYLLLHDFVGRSWEVKRYGRLKASYLSSRAPDALGFLLRDLQVSEPDRARLIKGWLSGDPAARAEIRTLLVAAGWDETVIDARSLGMSLKPMEGIERLSMMAEASRANAWRALIRHRVDLAERFAQPQALIDGVFSECTDGTDCADDPDGKGCAADPDGTNAADRSDRTDGADDRGDVE